MVLLEVARRKNILWNVMWPFKQRQMLLSERVCVLKPLIDVRETRYDGCESVNTPKLKCTCSFRQDNFHYAEEMAVYSLL